MILLEAFCEPLFNETECFFYHLKIRVIKEVFENRNKSRLNKFLFNFCKNKQKRLPKNMDSLFCFVLLVGFLLIECDIIRIGVFVSVIVRFGDDLLHGNQIVNVAAGFAV